MFDLRSITGPVALIIAGSLVLVGLAVAGTAVPSSSPADMHAPNASPIEEAYEESVPDRDDPYYEAEDPDGNWISYINPRDEYRSPYLGDGSGKVCVTLLNEEGEPIVGESVPETTVTVPTGDSLEWHPNADPFAVQYPLTDHYERPLDADQFGTNPELTQGDGYLDSHCLEWHGLPEDGTVEYGEVEIDGEYAEWIDVVGYIQQAHDSWDSDVDPIADAESYEEAGGGWTYETDGSHGQAVVVLQLDPPEDAYGGDDDDQQGSDDTNTSGGTDQTDDDGEDTRERGSSGDDTGGDDEIPGFSLLLSLTALASLVIVLARS